MYKINLITVALKNTANNKIYAFSIYFLLAE